MSKYWFKKGQPMMPATWEGWVIFVILIIALTQIGNFFDGLIEIFVVSFAIAALGMAIIKHKSPPK